MKLDLQLVLNMFALFSDLDGAALEKWESICENSSVKISETIRKDVDVKLNMERLCCAAAACAYCDYLMVSNGGASSSSEVKVGDISFKNADSQNMCLDAIGTREHFLNDIRDLLESPEIFAFRQAETLI